MQPSAPLEPAAQPAPQAPPAPAAPTTPPASPAPPAPAALPAPPAPPAPASAAPPAPPAPLALAASGSRRGVRSTSIVGAVTAVVLLGAGVFGGNAYAKNTICSALSDGTTLGSLSGGSSDEPSGDDITHMREAGDELRAYGHVLVFDHDLRSAVNGFADDVDQLADLLSDTDDSSDGLTRLMTVAGSLNTHVGQAQEACGLPVKSIFND